LIDAILALVYGLVIGSFLNVCVHRWPRGRSVVKPRSHCVRCRKPIAWYDNVPVISYVLLRGRCRHCGRHISIRYPIVELLTGLVFFVLVLTQPRWQAIKMCVFAAILIGLLFSDLEKRLLPDQFTLGGALVGFAFAFFVPVSGHTGQMLLWLIGFDVNGRAEWVAESALGALLPAGVLWLGGWIFYKVRHREGLGFGDVKLVMMAGAFLGLEGALLTLLIGSVAGSILGYGFIKLTRRDSASYELPFGTFLGAAGLVVALFQQRFLSGF
jgi:leader peptidase (prepilin peptidase)/N-methyltransferase